MGGKETERDALLAQGVQGKRKVKHQGRKNWSEKEELENYHQLEI